MNKKKPCIYCIHWRGPSQHFIGRCSHEDNEKIWNTVYGYVYNSTIHRKWNRDGDCTRFEPIISEYGEEFE